MDFIPVKVQNNIWSRSKGVYKFYTISTALNPNLEGEASRKSSCNL